MNKSETLFYEDFVSFTEHLKVSTSIASYANGDYPSFVKDIAQLANAAVLHVLCMRDVQGSSFTLRKAKNVYTTMCTGPYDVILSELKKFDNLVLHYFGEDEADFRTGLNGLMRGFALGTKQIIGLVLKDEVEAVISDNDESACARIHQICQFASRITLKDNPTALSSAVIKYELSMINILQHDDVLATDHMAKRVQELFRGFENPLLLYSPHHSSGAVSEKVRDKSGRLRSLTLEEKWLHTNGPITHYLLAQAGIMRYPTQRLDWVNRTTRQIFVPKGVDTRRIVEPEPTQLMFNQHGMAEALNHVLRVRLGRHYHQEDSGFNRRLAMEGSISREYDTLDLSSASDSVRNSLVKSLFRLLPRWQRLLQLVRSTHSVWADGRTRLKVMYGTMGNPLTFPLEVLTFCMLIEEACRRCSKDPKKLKYLVYGDDLIVPHWLTSTLLEVLDEFGFTCNVDKSFIGDCPFRESCGGDYLNGSDITPVRLSRNWIGVRRTVGEKISKQQIASAIVAANASIDVLPLVRKYCIEALGSSRAGSRIVFSNFRSGSAVLRTNSKSPSNKQLQIVGSNVDLQYPQIRALVVKLNHAIPLSHERYVEDVLYWDWQQRHSRPDKRVSGGNPLSALPLGTPYLHPDGLILGSDFPHLFAQMCGINEEDISEKVLEYTFHKMLMKGEIDLVCRKVDNIYY